MSARWICGTPRRISVRARPRTSDESAVQQPLVVVPGAGLERRLEPPLRVLPERHGLRRPGVRPAASLDRRIWTAGTCELGLGALARGR